MISRKEYLAAGRDHDMHRRYYEQFITVSMEVHIQEHIGINRLLSSTDEHFNDIDITEWYNMILYLKDKKTGKLVTDTRVFRTAVGEFNNYLHKFRFDHYAVDKALKECGDLPSIAGYVCIFKECARQMVEKFRRGSNTILLRGGIYELSERCRIGTEP